MKIKQKIKIKGKNTPVFIEGEDNGVIATQILEVPDDYSPMDIAGTLDEKENFLKRNVEVVQEWL